jgi:RHH-type proline utilization regulon transcriptional repressor/proline dehydrogenase/delta 1-pyrroline-5-carboxylate dehydrogenase
LQRRILARALDDEHFKTQLFRFVDVYPSLRDSGDVVRHLRAYLDEGGELPRPLDRLLRSSGGQRLPSWAVARLTERGMERMARSLIAGRDAAEALPTLKHLRRRHTGFTLDILGEACLSEAEAEEYVRRYLDVLDILPSRAARWSTDETLDSSPWGEVPRVNLSLKLTSLYSQIDPLDFEGSRAAVGAALKPLLVAARNRGVFVNLDLERFAYHDLTYAVFTDLALDDDLRDYEHLGVAVQSYLRDSVEDVQDLVVLARRRGTPFTVRLVKGAYWDYETIIAAQEHWPSPVFSHKAQTDAQFERIAGLLIENSEWTRPAIGTHNIRSIAAVVATAEAAGLPATALEVQVLHGMAEPIRRAAVAQGYRVREYVPVGQLIPGMAYLVRRLLENTANESFLRLAFAQQQGPEELMAAPGAGATAPGPATARGADEATGGPDVGKISKTETAPPPAPAVAPAESVALPETLAPPETVTLPQFQNEPHADFSRPESRAAMRKALATIRGSLGREYALLIGGLTVTTGTSVASTNPARPGEIVGTVASAGPADADRALDIARAAFPGWRDTPAQERVDTLLRAAALIRTRRFELAALEVVEAGKPWREADADVTEAIDFLEYYSREMLRVAGMRSLSDVPGEEDLYFYEPRGVAAVITPWNFPLAIPTGMVAAALAAGNTVVFKPANPTPVLGYALVRILHEAGVPAGAVNFLPGPGSEIGDYLVSDPRVDLVAFTGSLEVGLSIMGKAVAVAPGQRNIKKVIAEMGGKNAIIIDSDADLDAAVEGVIVSAFHYAGQKCSACSRVIVLEAIHDQFVRRLVQAAGSLKVGDPGDPGTRVGPVITAEARDRVLNYIEQGKSEARLIFPEAAFAFSGASGAKAGSPAAAASSTGGGPLEDGASEAPAAAATGEASAEGGASPAPTEGGDLEAPAIAGATVSAQPAGDGGTAQPAATGHFIPPHVFVDVHDGASIAQEEIFGPVLAVLKAHDFGQALEFALGVRYGLTGGLYSRNPAHIARAHREFRVGNLYINRPITGAMVGRQPFGGSRMSGVGSKAGGPDYLLQFLDPRTVTENTIRRGFAPPDAPASTRAQ